MCPLQVMITVVIRFPPLRGREEGSEEGSEQGSERGSEEGARAGGARRGQALAEDFQG